MALCCRQLLGSMLWRSALAESFGRFWGVDFRNNRRRSSHPRRNQSTRLTPFLPLIHFACLNKTHLCFLASFSHSTDSFGKSNVAYITWIVGGILVAEGFTGGMTDMLWSAANSGRLYESVDWTKFVVEDDDDDDDDDEDDDEDEEEGDDDDEE